MLQSAVRPLRPGHPFLTLLLAVLVLLAAGACAPGRERAAGVPDGKTASGPPPAPFGAYVGYGSEGVRRISGLDGWLGPATPRVGHAYLAGDRWSHIEGAPGDLPHWAQWRRARADRLFVLNVPMLDRAEAHLPDRVVRGLLRRGADGAYDGHFRTLARRLVSLGIPDTVLVVGWEMNGITYTHRCGPDPAAWKAYWVRIVETMRSVAGQRFRFEFAPNRGRDAVPWTACYPGDRYVDVLGMDAYDQPPGMSFEEQVHEPYGLAAHVRFAREHGKPFSYPEWGLFRNGDNPAYVRGMLGWFARHRPLYQTISDYCPHGVWRCAANPRSSDVYRRLMTGPFG
ncbi:glycoside hydrolase family 26 protein [Streptomyces sp. NPDC001388]|uniref:glycoside hydrolase family 26 protein n=1 Tax=unclassified Streptomyces TaxID=2593676 RepID=UPI003689393D